MSDEPIRCPKCHSTQIHVDKKGFSVGKAIAGGMVTGNILVAAAAGGIGMNDIELTCLKCGRKFKASETYSTTSVEHDRKIAEFENHVIQERTQTAMYKCACGKESCLPIDKTVCSKCGRQLNDNYKITPMQPTKGCIGILIVPIIIATLLLL